MTWTSAALTDRLGGDRQLATELVDIFLSEYPHLLEALRASVVHGDAQAIRRAAHALKGTVANFIDDGPVTTAFAIERAATEGRLGDVAPLMTQLEPEIEALIADMRQVMAR